MQHTGTEAQGCLMMEAHEKDSRDPWTGKMEGQRMLLVGSSELGLQELGLGKAGIEVYLTGSSMSASMECLCYKSGSEEPGGRAICPLCLFHACPSLEKLACP